MRALTSCRPRRTLSEAQQFRRDGGGWGMRKIDYLSDHDRTRIVQEVAEQLDDLGQHRFPRTKNLEYALLKTHVIIDHALTHFIRCTSGVLVEPECLRFTFAQKLEIAVLHGFGNGDPISLPSVELLNRIRNHVAHRLTIDRELVNELIRLNTEDIDVAQLTDVQRIAFLRSWCAFLCGHMSGWLTAMVVTTKGA